MRRTGDLKLIQELNRSIIFDTIREKGPISRSEIAKKNGLSPTTVTAAVFELIAEGLVKEGGTGTSSGGRKPIMLQFSPDSRSIIVVSITNTNLTVGEVNLNAEVKRKRQFNFPNFKGDQVIDYTLQAVQEFLEDIPNRASCLGISLSVSGIVDAQEGVLLYNNQLKLKDIHFQKIIEERFGLKTWIDNDVNAMVLAEKKFGKYRDKQNIIYISIGDGIGAGIIVNGEIYKGVNGGAGELGHTSVDGGDIRCECGNYGCLEAYIGWPAIYSKLVTALTRETTSLISDLAYGDLTKITPAVLHQAVQKNDQLAMEVMEHISGYLGRGMVNIVNLFNPDLIILGGGTIDHDQFFLDTVRQIVLNKSIGTLSKDLQIEYTSFRQNADLIAASAVSLQDIFNFSLENRM